MSKYDVSPYQKQPPVIQMAPLIDIVFITLIFFMTISIFSQLESEISISVPKSSVTKETVRSPGQIIINITKNGVFVVNQKELNISDLQGMLKKVSKLFPDQPVIIRADEETHHKYVIQVLDICAKSDIWDISFSTARILE